MKEQSTIDVASLKNIVWLFLLIIIIIQNNKSFPFLLTSCFKLSDDFQRNYEH